MPPLMPGIYIHVPFCRKKCGYCDFYSVEDLGSAEAYTQAVIAEAEYYARTGMFSGAAVDTIYCGGGTPACIGGARVARILDALRRQWPVAPDAEITVELNPESTDAPLLHTLKSAGVTRVSLGVQSFHDTTLSFLGRVHTADDARRACALIAAACFPSWGLDLMYAVPGLTAAVYEETVREACEWAVPHLSAYALTLEEGVPLAMRGLALPNDDEVRTAYAATIDMLEAAGYCHYELSNFAAADNHRSRHNNKYWHYVPYLGLGPAAHSFDGTERWENIPDVAHYCATVSRGSMPVRASETISEKTMLTERLMLGLRDLSSGVLMQDLDRAAGGSFATQYAVPLRELSQQGLVTLTDGRLRLTYEGRFLHTAIVREFV